MKRYIALLLAAAMLFILPVQAMAKSKKMEADVPVWTEETVRKYISDYVDGGHMDELYSYYDLQIRRYMPEVAYEKMLTELEWMTGDFVCLGAYSSFEESARVNKSSSIPVKTHVVHMHMTKQDLDVYFTHKNFEDDWEVMALEFVPAAKQDIDTGFAVDSQPQAADAYVESAAVINEGGEYPLDAIITLPAALSEGQKVPACVLVHDAGPMDKNASVGATRFFEHLAQELADMGIASIRYDKRTFVYGEDVAETVYEEAVADAVAAANLLTENESVDSNRIYVIGHGFGALVAPYIAEESNGVVSGMILIGSRPESYARQLLETADLSSLSRDEASDLNEFIRNLRRQSEADARALEMFGRNGYYFWDMEQHNHVSLIMNLELPTYIVQGRNDGEVSENDGWRAWSEELKHYGEFVDYQSYRGLNHMLANDLSVDENGKPQYLVDAGIEVTAVRDIAGWILNQQEVEQ
ncbi:MAG: alpha/beta fold hydrolase [Clostridia bacterium]|nr:alpha/beta fold hydrolase [Clostridia bacterium]MBP3648520.1 alpha/beta fold hydrolase [Clostridia bacterium]